MIPPSRLGLPHPAWRSAQADAIWSIMESPHRFLALIAPTGFGKTAVDLAATRLHTLQTPGHRSIICTSTRALQDQYSSYPVKAKRTYHLIDVRGQSHFDCLVEPVKVAEGPCHMGMKCDLRSSCEYYLRIDRATRHTAVTNYAWWLAYNAYSDFPPPNLLILDEAHAAPEELAEFLSVNLTKHDCGLLKSRPPSSGWVSWSKDMRSKAQDEFDFLRNEWRTPEARRRALKLKEVGRKLDRLARAEEKEWVREDSKWGTRFDPIWPAPYAEDYLFRGAEKVLLVSATVREKTLDLLGIPKDQRQVVEYPSTFPLSRRPVRIVTGAVPIRLTHKSTDAELMVWVRRMDQLISARLDKKGIIHCVSYNRMDFIRRHSLHRDRYITHESGGLDKAISRFREAGPGAILLSPAADTGYDFPYYSCEYSIIAKVPFPDSRSRILQARAKVDKDYGIYLTAITIMQAAGRGMRAEDDMHEVLIPDYQISWVVGKHRAFFTKWFLDAVEWCEQLPKPLPKLP